MDSSNAHAALSASVGAISLLVTILGFFLAREFSQRDEHQKDVKAQFALVNKQLSEHASALAVFESTGEAALEEIKRAAIERSTVLAAIAGLQATIDALHRELDQMRHDFERNRPS